MTESVPETTILLCSFCQKPLTDVKAMVEAKDGGATICNECVKKAVEAAKKPGLIVPLMRRQGR